MRDDQLEKLTVAELKELGARVETAIASRLVDERNRLREELKSLAEEAGYTLAEIVGGGGKGGKGRTVAAQFVNPADPRETWSGRGRQPKWLAARLKSGATREDFRVA